MDPAGSSSLGIRVRTVVGGADGDTITTTVSCPRRDITVHLGECLECERCIGVTPDGDEGGSILKCRHPPRADRAGGTPPVAEIMSRNVTCVRPTMFAADTIAVMIAQNVSGFPVVDGSGKVVGVVSKTDLLREVSERGSVRKATVKDVMTETTYTLTERSSVGQAAALMAWQRIHRLPIVDELGRVVGILSSLDALRWLAEHDGFVVPSH